MAQDQSPGDEEQLLAPPDLGLLGRIGQSGSAASDDEITEDVQPLGLQEPAAVLKDAVERKRRYLLAGALLAVSVVLTVGIIVIAVWGSENAWTRTSSQVGFLLTPFHTLMGIAIGYYFAEQRRSS